MDTKKGIMKIENKILNKEVAQTNNDFPNQVEAWRSIVNTDVRTG